MFDIQHSIFIILLNIEHPMMNNEEAPSIQYVFRVKTLDLA